MKTTTLEFIFIAFLAACRLLSGAAEAKIDTGKYNEADTAKQCAICHYRWVVTFYVEHRGTPIAPLEEEKVVGSQEICISCHDGSVVDSRDRICNDPGHRVGNIPSDRVKIPETFPLDEKGAMRCSTCHTPHAVFKEELKACEDFFLRAPNVDSSLCKQCHITKIGGKKKGNHPVDVRVRDIPQAVLDGGGKLGTKQQIICETCHSPHGGVNNRFLVLEVDDPTTRSVLCEVCHTKTPGLTGEESHREFSHPYDLLPGRIPSIPMRWKSGRELVLGHGGELVCRTCHMPHAAADQKALLAEPNQKDSLCIECHANHGRIASSVHYRKIVRETETNIMGDKASELGPCSPCHLAHHGIDRLMWARWTTGIEGKPGEYCYSCHRKGGTAEKFMLGDFMHPLDIPMPDTLRPASLPLFDDEGENPNGEIRCATCHNFHDPQPLFNDPDDEGVRHSNFLRLSPEGGAGVCVQCHPKQGLVSGTDHDLSLTAPGFKNASGHTPAEAGVCNPCHVIHKASQQEYLWAAPLGPDRMSGWGRGETSEGQLMPRLCTGCHSPQGIAAKKVPRFGLHPETCLIPPTGAPGGASWFAATGGEAPLLFTADGNLNENGRIVCSTCHDPHQWDSRRRVKGSGRLLEGTAGDSFLRKDLQSTFCPRCHGADGLVKFQYFHREPSRKKQKDKHGVK